MPALGCELNFVPGKMVVVVVVPVNSSPRTLCCLGSVTLRFASKSERI